MTTETETESFTVQLQGMHYLYITRKFEIQRARIETDFDGIAISMEGSVNDELTFGHMLAIAVEGDKGSLDRNKYLALNMVNGLLVTIVLDRPLDMYLLSASVLNAPMGRILDPRTLLASDDPVRVPLNVKGLLDLFERASKYEQPKP